MYSDTLGSARASRNPGLSDVTPSAYFGLKASTAGGISVRAGVHGGEVVDGPHELLNGRPGWSERAVWGAVDTDAE